MSKLGFGGKIHLDIIKYRWLWLGISALFLIPCITAMIYSMVTLPTHTPVKLGLDFTGGSFLQYGFQQGLAVKDIDSIRAVLQKVVPETAVIQIQKPADVLGKLENEATEQTSTPAPASKEKEKPQPTAAETTTQPAADTTEQTKTERAKQTTTPASTEQTATQSTEKTTTETTSAAENNKEEASVATTSMKKSDIKTVVSIRIRFLEEAEMTKLNELLKAKYGEFSILQTTAVGPALGKELLKNAMVALLLVFGAIVVYLSFRFQLDYAVFALIALVHDAIFVIGAFSIFGLVYNTEIDSLFVSAILTVIGFSVHDSIVVFDRIRENSRFLSKKKSFNEICNESVNQTLARSINTSLTAVIVLLCMVFFGGGTTKDFVLAMALGIMIGTYSSIFNASVLLALWREFNAPKSRTRKVPA